MCPEVVHALYDTVSLIYDMCPGLVHVLRLSLHAAAVAVSEVDHCAASCPVRLFHAADVDLTT